MGQTAVEHGKTYDAACLCPARAAKKETDRNPSGRPQDMTYPPVSKRLMSPIASLVENTSCSCFATGAAGGLTA